jgi:pimeloyl-ACP methyl ester carboxylesterase
MEKFLKALRTLLVWLVILAAIVLTIFYFAQDFVSLPGRGLYTANPSEWNRRVASLGSQGFFPVDFVGGAGQTVQGIWAPCGLDAGPAILWLHSREQTTTEINQDLKPLTHAGLHVFALEFRGYGVSTGATSEANILADAEATLEWMSKKEGIAGKRIFVGGLGLGANLALKIAARNPVHGVVAVSPLPDLATGVASAIPVVPLGFLLKENFELAPDLPALAVPVFFIHGTEDKVVTLGQVEQMVSLVGSPVRLREVPGAGHLDPLEKGGRELVEEIDLFKDRPR